MKSQTRHRTRQLQRSAEIAAHARNLRQVMINKRAKLVGACIVVGYGVLVGVCYALSYVEVINK